MRIFVTFIVLMITASSISAKPFFTAEVTDEDGKSMFLDMFATEAPTTDRFGLPDPQNCTDLLKYYIEGASQRMDNQGYRTVDYRYVMYKELNDIGSVFFQVEMTHQINKIRFLMTCMDTDEMEASESKRWTGKLE